MKKSEDIENLNKGIAKSIKERSNEDEDMHANSHNKESSLNMKNGENVLKQNLSIQNKNQITETKPNKNKTHVNVDSILHNIKLETGELILKAVIK